MNQDTKLARFLDFLEVGVEAPTLAYLNKLVEAHQTKVRWETITKFIDFEEGKREDYYLPSIDSYLDRVVDQGTGGTCWTLARGFHYVLDALGFQVEYLYMDPGHLCLQVMLDQPYYVDIGYCAPLYRAYPLLHSFTAENELEVFRYEVREDDILVTREPGPTKILGKNPVPFEELIPHILNSHDWLDGFALRSLKVFGYIDDKPYQVKENKLITFHEKTTIEKELSAEEVRYWIEEKFGIDFSLYERAKEIYDKRKG